MTGPGEFDQDFAAALTLFIASRVQQMKPSELARQLAESEMFARKARESKAEQALSRVRVIADDLEGVTGARYIAQALRAAIDGE